MIGRALAALLLLAAPALAHRLNADARLVEGEVLLEVYFSDGAAPADATVEVLRGLEPIASGVADDQGRFRWRPPGPGRYLFVVTEPGLHKAQVEIDVPSAAPVAVPDSASISVPASASEERAHARAPAGEADPPHRGGTPWGGVAAGLGVIAALTLILALAQRRRGAG